MPGFDLSQIALNLNKKNDGVLFWYGGEGDGVPFILRHTSSDRYQHARGKAVEKNAFQLRGGHKDAVAEKIACDTMAQHLVIAWGNGITYNGQIINGQDLYSDGQIVKWEKGSNGLTSEASWKKLSTVLNDPRYSPFKLQLVMWSNDDEMFQDLVETAPPAEDVENLS